MAEGTSPTARALRVLELLAERPGVSAEQLAERLGVSERAARRYVETLREAGIPVRSTRGPGGGYRLGPRARLAPVSFTQEEALVLVMAVLAAGSPDCLDPLAGALAKLVRALPEGVRERAAAVRRHTWAVPDRRAAPPDPIIASALVAAAAAHQRVAITYRSRPDPQRPTEVDPWAVIVRHGYWYLLCHAHHACATRTYRLDRIVTVTPCPARFTPPEGLDPIAVLEEHLGAGRRYPTRVRFLVPVEQIGPWVSPPMGRLQADGECCVLVGTTDNPAAYAQEWLAAIPYDYRIEQGPELAAAVAALAARCAAAVANT